MDMTGKVALITGASRGIGAETARLFAKQGAQVALLARSGDSIADLAGEIGDAALAVPCDVARFWEVDQAVQATVAAFGRLDIVINNAGVIEPVSRLAEADPDRWNDVIDINFKGVFHGMRAALPMMLEAGQGTILTIGSGAAHNPIEGWSHYCSSKAGALMLTRMVHKEYGEAGIRAISLSPGTVATQMQREIKASGVNPVSQLDWSVHIPADWPARALLWMCTADADGFLGAEVSLRDETIREKVGLT